jgi:hypothetical protein
MAASNTVHSSVCARGVPLMGGAAEIPAFDSYVSIPDDSSSNHWGDSANHQFVGESELLFSIAASTTNSSRVRKVNTDVAIRDTSAVDAESVKRDLHLGALRADF